MNYATIEEAWAKPKGTLNKFPVSSVKHPLVAKSEMDAAHEEKSLPPTQDVDPDEIDIKAMAALRRTLRRLFEERGSFGVDLVLPMGYVQEQQAKKSQSLDSFMDIEEIAKWMLMAAVLYIIFDLAK